MSSNTKSKTKSKSISPKSNTKNKYGINLLNNDEDTISASEIEKNYVLFKNKKNIKYDINENKELNDTAISIKKSKKNKNKKDTKNKINDSDSSEDESYHKKIKKSKKSPDSIDINVLHERKRLLLESYSKIIKNLSLPEYFNKNKNSINELFINETEDFLKNISSTNKLIVIAKNQKNKEIKNDIFSLLQNKSNQDNLSDNGITEISIQCASNYKQECINHFKNVSMNDFLEEYTN